MIYVLKAEALDEQFNSVQTKGVSHCQICVKVYNGEIDRLQISISGVLDQLNKLNPSK